ncbi:phosphatase PAP2 family protein [Peribacillus sp. R9-11]|uniref:phosphatase PAP2 family protein n=1 Tax=Peribacillus sp. R9-11 TaxID=3073271 RepID=UPI002868B0F1|nr:phosphatase PAP2 family protein [Peribacillus sp. R9-11]WMX54669.1 phosphatase PAP2 family protein [Peribacillus sp. R9-11]
MKLKFQLSIAFVLSVIFLIGFSIMAFTISAYELLNFDRAVISFVQGLESPFLTTIMKVFTFIGSSSSIIILSLLVLFYLYKVLKHRLELVLFSAVVVGSTLLNLILKLFFQRARPDLHRLIEIGGYSFPSGHAMNAFTLYGILTFLLWRHISTMWGRTLLILFSVMMILTIGISRIYLGVHYPSDIIGGYLASGCWLAISIWVFQKYKESQKNKEIN